MLLVSTRPNSIAEVGSETSLVISHDEFMMAVDRDEFLEVNIKHPHKIQTCISLSMLHIYLLLIHLRFIQQFDVSINKCDGPFRELNWCRNQYTRSIIINLI